MPLLQRRLFSDDAFRLSVYHREKVDQSILKSSKIRKNDINGILQQISQRKNLEKKFLNTLQKSLKKPQLSSKSPLFAIIGSERP